jgi:hypothetical protein
MFSPQDELAASEAAMREAMQGQSPDEDQDQEHRSVR